LAVVAEEAVFPVYQILQVAVAAVAEQLQFIQSLLFPEHMRMQLVLVERAEVLQGLVPLPVEILHL
jgi:hypothetical protein